MAVAPMCSLSRDPVALWFEFGNIRAILRSLVKAYDTYIICDLDNLGSQKPEVVYIRWENTPSCMKLRRGDEGMFIQDTTKKKKKKGVTLCKPNLLLTFRVSVLTLISPGE
jgi:hypothetical protein